MAPATAPRNYWQLPTFLLGVAAAVAAGKYAPPPAADPAGDFRDTLAALARAVEKRPADVAAVEKLTRRVVEEIDHYPAAAGEAQYLAGSGYLVLAVYGPPEAAADNWKLADQHFGRCDPAGLPDPEVGKRFVFRSAEAAAAAGSNVTTERLGLLSQPPAGEDAIEVPRLIALACLRQTPPDLKRARDELAHYLSLPNPSPAAAAARYKLELAGLHVKLGEPDKARRWLKDIGPAANPEVQAEAKLKLAGMAVAESNWADAVKHYEAARSIPGLSDDRKGPVLYQTGFAYLQMGNPSQAGQYLEQAAREPGPLGAAAAVRMAELRIRDAASKGRRADAADWLEKAGAGVKSADEFKAAEVQPAEVRAAFEEVIKRAAAEEDYAAAARAATAYAAVAEAGRDKERRAEVNAAWAVSLEKANPGEARAKHKAAGADYAAAAASAPAGRTELLRRAAAHLKQGGAAAEALAATDQLLAAKDVPPEAAGQVWLDKAELLPATDDAGVTGALNKAMEYPGPAAASARLKLALHNLTRGKQQLDSADPAGKKKGEGMVVLGRQLLTQIADASTVAPAEAPSHEEAVFQLGSLFMAEGQFAEAEVRFRKQVQLYPDGRMAGNGRLWLACCLVQQGYAGGPTDKRLQEAIELLTPLRSSPVEFLRTQAEIRTLNTLVVQQKYDAVVKLGGELADKYRGTPDELVVGKLLFYSFLNRSPAEPGEALRVLLRMEDAFKGMAAAAFPADPDYSHDRWARELPSMRQELEKRKQ